MAMHKFKIKYLVKGKGPDEVETTTVRFGDILTWQAYELAQEFAADISRHGWYSVTEIPDEE